MRKVFDEGVLSLNDAVEFFGILSIDPSLSRFEESNAMEHDLVAQVLAVSTFCVPDFVFLTFS